MFGLYNATGGAGVPSNRSNFTWIYSFCTGSMPSLATGTAFYCIILVLSLIGNLLIVVVFIRKKAHKTPVHYFIVNMAVSDLLIPVIVIPWQLSNIYLGGLWLVDGILGTIMCKLVGIARGIYPCVSILSMMAISVERFWAILFPMKAMVTQSRKICICVIVASWLISIMMRGHYLYAYKLVRLNPSILLCSYSWSPKSFNGEMLKINWLVFFCLCIVSAVLLASLYFIICVYLCSKKQNVYMASATIKRRTIENRQVICMLITTVSFFYAIYTPYHIFAFFFYLKPGIKLPCYLYWFSKHLHFMYTVFNPFAYYIFSHHYRQGVRELFGFLCPFKFGNRTLKLDIHPGANVTNDVTLSGLQITDSRTIDTAL